MNFLLFPNASLLLVMLTLATTISIAFAILWLINRVSDRLDKLGWTGSGQPPQTSAIAEKLLEVARCVSFKDEINLLDLEFVRLCLERELPAKISLNKQAAKPTRNSLPVELPHTVVDFFKEWGSIEGIGSFNFSLGGNCVTDCGCGVFEIGFSDASTALIVVPSDVVFERENDSQLEWDVNPIAKTIYHFALKLCRESSYEDNVVEK